MSFRPSYLAASVAVAAMLASAPAAAVTVIFTSDFENDGNINVPNNAFRLYDFADGWNKDTPPGNQIEVQRNVAGAPRAGSGTNFVELDSTANASMTYQNTALAAGTYKLDFWYSSRPSSLATDNGISVFVNGSLLPMTALTSASGSTTNWTFISRTFTSAAPFKLQFAATGLSNSYGGYIDDITLSAVPEPATWAMMIGGFGLVGASMRRRNRMVAKLA